MFAFERRWLAAVFASVTGADDVPFDRFVDEVLRHAPKLAVTGLRAALWVVMLSPPFVLRRMRTFFGLDHDARMALLERLSLSRTYALREIPMMLKTVACMGYGGLPEVHRRLGVSPTDEVPPPWRRGAA